MSFYYFHDFHDFHKYNYESHESHESNRMTLNTLIINVYMWKGSGFQKLKNKKGREIG